MTDRKKESLLKLAAIAERKGEVKLPLITSFSVNLKMPHEKDVEIGERIIRKKMCYR